MDGNRVVIDCVGEEESLAKIIEACIEEVFSGQLHVSQCTGYKLPELLKERDGGTCVILMLCSPFSVNQPELNFAAGVATIHAMEAEKAGKIKVSIIPICHSGQRSKDLPKYLESRQAMEMQHDLFVKQLAGGIARKFGIVEIPQGKYSEFIEKFKDHKFSFTGNVGNNAEKMVVNSCCVKMTKTDNVIEIAPTEPSGPIDRKAWPARIRRMNQFLDDSSMSIEQIGLSIGIQNCLFIGKDIFVGLRIKFDKQTDFLTSARGMFEPGYALLGSADDLNALKWPEKGVCNGVLEYMERRAKSSDMRMCRIKHNGNEYPATIFINNSRQFPRFEVGIWNCINVADGAVSVENNIYPDENSKDYAWIWVKDGRICYWSFPNEASIPRHISPESTKSINPSLVEADQMKEVYGRQEKFTLYASDEDITVGRMIKNRFSASARVLLTCY